VAIIDKNNLAKFGSRKKKSFYILGYLLELNIKMWRFGKKIL
jgi:hypothetical protein